MLCVFPNTQVNRCKNTGYTIQNTSAALELQGTKQRKLIKYTELQQVVCFYDFYDFCDNWPAKDKTMS